MAKAQREGRPFIDRTKKKVAAVQPEPEAPPSATAGALALVPQTPPEIGSARFIFAVGDVKPMALARWKLLFTLVLAADSACVCPVVNSSSPTSGAASSTPDAYMLVDFGSAVAICRFAHAPHVPIQPSTMVPMMGAGEGHKVTNYGSKTVHYIIRAVASES